MIFLENFLNTQSIICLTKGEHLVTGEGNSRVTIRLTIKQQSDMKKLMNSGRFKTQSELCRTALNIGFEKIIKKISDEDA